MQVIKFTNYFANNPRANGAERRSGRMPGVRVLIPPGYLHPGGGHLIEVRLVNFVNI
jgi:hypothetical protein